ncbi:MAG: Taurine import ATP-binding protein TauB [Gammaproteobacteria bacterium]|nr:Taurine import ATP-binding protein TauB [Gammaproteobacteria bacterium]
MASLTVDHVAMHYAVPGGIDVHALEDVSFTLEKGEMLAILGPSGCGKTTLLNIIAGFLTPTEGKTMLNDEPIVGPSSERGVVFQQGALFEWLTVAENIGFGPRMKGKPKNETDELIDHLLDTVGLHGYGGTAIYSLSGGMQQRVALARCLANDPELILMDEPLGALDALTREKMQGLLLRLWNETGKTIILITHSVEEALFLGANLFVMAPRPGRIIKIDALPFPKRGLIENPREIKAAPDFIEKREEVLSMIWEMEEQIMGHQQENIG